MAASFNCTFEMHGPETRNLPLKLPPLFAEYVGLTQEQQRREDVEALWDVRGGLHANGITRGDPDNRDTLRHRHT